MGVLNFIIDNILINAAVVLGLVALLGLILQRKPVSECISGTFKTMMGFMILSAGSNVIVGALEPFSTWFSAGLGIQGSVASIEAVLAVAMTGCSNSASSTASSAASSEAASSVAASSEVA